MPDVVLPALNEAAALPSVLLRFPEGYRAIVVDNGSTDRTADVARECGAIVVSETQKGFGSACWAGLQAATDDIICFMDADASFDAQQLPELVAVLTSGGADLVLGSRQADKGAWPWHARLANRVLVRLIRVRSGVKVADLGPMRVMYRQKLLDLGMTDRRSGWPLEMVLRARRAGLTIAEVPVRYQPRVGTSKVTGTVRGTARAIGDMTRLLASFESESQLS